MRLTDVPVLTCLQIAKWMTVKVYSQLSFCQTGFPYSHTYIGHMALYTPMYGTMTPYALYSCDNIVIFSYTLGIVKKKHQQLVCNWNVEYV
jgi:hypothetical protein